MIASWPNSEPLHRSGVQQHRRLHWWVGVVEDDPGMVMLRWLGVFAPLEPEDALRQHDDGGEWGGGHHLGRLNFEHDIYLERKEKLLNETAGLQSRKAGMEAGGDELKQRAEEHIERAKSLGIRLFTNNSRMRESLKLTRCSD